MNTGRFDFEKASQSAGWIRELMKEEHTPETEEYGIHSFVYHRKRPFHPERLLRWIANWPDNIVRSKGLMWLATRNHMAISFSHAGTSKQLAAAGVWVGAMSEEERELHFGDTLPSIPDWDDEWGDRVTKLVFIGIDMDRAEIKRTLDETLLTEEEMRMNWRELKDPFPAWR